MSVPRPPTAEETAALQAGASLLGARVRFRHQPKGPDRRITVLHCDGMVEIEGFSGCFAPHLFILMDSDQ